MDFRSTSFKSLSDLTVSDISSNFRAFLKLFALTDAVSRADPTSSNSDVYSGYFSITPSTEDFTSSNFVFASAILESSPLSNASLYSWIALA